METNMNSKNILVIGNTDKMGGVETFIYNTTMGADRNQFQFFYLVHGSDHCVFEKEINEFYPGEQHIFFLPSYKKNPLKCIRALKTFYQKSQRKYDIIDLETGSAAEIVYVVPFAGRIQAKVIVHSHNGSGYSPFLNRIFRPIINRAADKRLACSDKAALWLFGKRHLKGTEIVNNGIDTKKFGFSYEARNKIRKDLGATEDTFVVGHIGRFAPQKNHRFLLRIFSEIIKKNPNSMLVLVGEGELQNEMKRLAMELSVEGKVAFVGRRNNPENYYSAFDLFLMPSLYEGLPIVGIEAQASGLPCLFSDAISRQAGLINHTAFFSLKETAGSWAAKALNSVCPLEERDRYARIVRSKGYDILDTIKKLEEIYTKL